MSNAELYEDMLGYDDTDYSSPRVTKKNVVSTPKSVVAKENTHIVIKREDALKYLTEVEYCALEKILNTVSEGRNKDGKKPFNNYYVCNMDEPYAEVVYGVIMGGEAVKNNQLN